LANERRAEFEHLGTKYLDEQLRGYVGKGISHPNMRTCPYSPLYNAIC
jgi:hypothetical protein